MTFSDFKDSLQQNTPTNNLPPTLQALWYDGKECWEKAHDLADGSNYPETDWVPS